MASKRSSPDSSENVYKKLRNERKDRYKDHNAEIDEEVQRVWDERMEECSKFIVKNGMRQPTRLIYETESDEELGFGRWIHIQFGNYVKKVGVFRSWRNSKKWERFVMRFGMVKQREKRYSLEKGIERYEEYLRKNGGTLSTSTASGHYFHTWMCRYYKYYEEKKGIMGKRENREIWREFVERNNIQYASAKSRWIRNLKRCVDIIERDGSLTWSNSNQCIYTWITSQLSADGNVAFMKDERKGMWEDFIEKYGDNIPKHYDVPQHTSYSTAVEKWEGNLGKLQAFVRKNKRRPRRSFHSTEEKRLEKFFNKSSHFYRSRSEIFRREQVVELWESFIRDNSAYIIPMRYG